MNLALLNPFRQADRIDSTLTIPRALHPPRPKSDANAHGGGGGNSAKSASAGTTSAAAASPAGEGDEKKKKKASASSPDRAPEGGGGGGFKIPKKQKFNDGSGSGKLFRQSLKLSKLSGEDGSAATASDVGGRDRAESSSTAGEMGAANPKDGEATDVEAKDADEVPGGDEESSPPDDDDAAAREGDDDAATPTGATPKQKKKRKKRPRPLHSASNAGASSETEDEGAAAANAASTDVPAAMSAAAADGNDDDESENYWTACYAVSFNRRGSFLASGHASGLVPVHDFLGRTMSALYWPPPPIALDGGGRTVRTKGRVGAVANNAGVELRTFVYGDHGANGKGGSGKGGEKKKRGPKPKPKKKKKGKKGDDDDVTVASAATAGSAGAAASPAPSSSLVKISSSDDLLVAAAAEELANSESAAAARAPTVVPAAKAENDVDDDEDRRRLLENSSQQLRYMNGVTSLSWDRRSRTLLAGAIGDKNLRLMDNTHPLVATDCTDAVRRQFLAESGGKDVLLDDDTTLDEKKAAVVAASPPVYTTLPAPPSLTPGYIGALLGNPGGLAHGARVPVRLETTSLGRARLLRSNVVSARGARVGGGLPSSPSPFSAAAAPSPLFFPPPLAGGSLLSPLASTVPSTPRSDAGRPPAADDVVSVPTRRHPTLLLELPQPLGGPVELHPRDSHAGLACMIDGSLALFYLPPMGFYETLHGKDDTMTTDGADQDARRRKYVMGILQQEELSRVGNLAYLVPPPVGDFDAQGTAIAARNRPRGPQYFITCAAFGKHGEVLWAVTKCGNLLAFRIDASMMNMLRGRQGNNDAAAFLSSSASAFANQMLRPTMCVKVPGGAAAWQIIVSRNGKYILINSADCSLRLFDVADLSAAFDAAAPAPGPANATRNADVKPRFVFQDNISKAPWASCDFSGDGEYVCGGCNSYPQPGDNYKLFLWNCITGELVDQLTGPVSSLYSLSCHPTRPFIAVGTSDGLIDVWGARLDWVAFAPDFQALQQNELYEEKEDEFDVVVDGDGRGDDIDALGGKGGGYVYGQLSPEDDDVDITTIGAGTAFDSDSEDELDVFYFDTKVEKILSEKQPGPKKAEHE